MINLDLTGLVVIREAIALSGFSPDYLRRLAREGTLPAQKVGRTWLFDRDALDEYKQRMIELGTAKHAPKETRGGSGDSSD